MKVRFQRTHFSGFSNRQRPHEQVKPETVFERSLKKSQSLFYKKDKNIQQSVQCSNRDKPFMGSHNELESLRFDKNKFKGYKEGEDVVLPSAKIYSFSHLLNNEVEKLKPEFVDKKINMHKLCQLKHTFVKNNKNRRNLKEYFSVYSNSHNQIETSGLKKLVNEYGYDINEDEAKFILKLTNRKCSEDKATKESLDLKGFIELMSKEDIYFKTMRIGSNNKMEEAREKVFSDKVHLILRNKFPKMKEAFEIYTKRKEKVGRKQFEKVIKKMDLTDLVMSQAEKEQLFRQYTFDDKFNVEAFLSDIIEDEQKRKIKIDKNFDFIDEIEVNEEKKDANEKRVRKYSLKNLSFVQYEKQFWKAQQIIESLRHLSKEQKHNLIEIIFEKESEERSAILKNTQTLFQKEGLNYKKDQYDAFLAYLDFDSNGSLSKQNLTKVIFHQTEKEARSRFERRTRNEPPKDLPLLVDCDEGKAKEAIRKIRLQKMNPENRQLFKYFDNDKDGFVSNRQLYFKLEKMQILSKEETENLVAYLMKQNKDKGYLKFSEFAKRIDIHEELPFVKRKHSLPQNDWKGQKKKAVQVQNLLSQKKNTKYSAWPLERRVSDFSLIQPPPNSAMYASEKDRFQQKREDYGLKEKMERKNVAENRRQRIASWSSKLIERRQNEGVKEEERMAGRNYFIRLTKQNYEQNCHK